MIILQFHIENHSKIIRPLLGTEMNSLKPFQTLFYLHHYYRFGLLIIYFFWFLIIDVDDGKTQTRKKEIETKKNQSNWCINGTENFINHIPSVRIRNAAKNETNGTIIVVVFIL